MSWYYTNNGVQVGPVAIEEIKAMLADGRIKPSDMVWKEGMENWLPVSQVPELNVAAPPAQMQAPAPPYQSPLAQQTTVQGADIPNYLWQSIAVTLLCCLPFGIAAIVYASKVDGLKMAGDLAGARQASENAKKWTIYSVVGWVIGVVLYILLIVFMGMAGGMSSSGSY